MIFQRRQSSLYLVRLYVTCGGPGVGFINLDLFQSIGNEGSILCMEKSPSSIARARKPHHSSRGCPRTNVLHLSCVCPPLIPCALLQNNLFFHCSRSQPRKKILFCRSPHTPDICLGWGCMSLFIYTLSAKRNEHVRCDYFVEQKVSLYILNTDLIGNTIRVF
jgi:hypothetical protein